MIDLDGATVIVTGSARGVCVQLPESLRRDHSVFRPPRSAVQLGGPGGRSNLDVAEVIPLRQEARRMR